MTERLSALLHDEAADLDVPPVDHASILKRGQQTRTRRRTTTLLAAAAVVAVVGTGTVAAVTAMGDHGEARTSAPAMSPAQSSGLVAYGSGSTVVIGDSTTAIPDTLHSLSYTSVGVLTRSNGNDGASDGSGPERLTLVAPDGATTDLGTIPEGVGPATDPDEPVYALAEASGSGFRAVVRDARTGEEVGSVALPDKPMSYWDVPPLALDGDVIYAGFKKEAVAFNWRTGAPQPASGVGGGLPEVRGGHAVGPDGASVVDAATGNTVLQMKLDTSEQGFASLSPDGRHLLISWDIDTTRNTSNFNAVSAAELDTLVAHANAMRQHYLQAGFDEVLLSVIPNKTTVVNPPMGRYNRLLERLETHPALQVPLISVRKRFMQSGPKLYQRGDSHWNCEGRQIWLEAVNRKISEN